MSEDGSNDRGRGRTTEVRGRPPRDQDVNHPQGPFRGGFDNRSLLIVVVNLLFQRGLTPVINFFSSDTVTAGNTV